MEQHNKEFEKRSRPRVGWHFVVQFKPKERKDAYWETSAVKDISEKGCFFYSNVSYAVGETLEIKILFPALREPMHFMAEVRRCQLEQNRLDVYGVGVSFVWVEEEKKKAFLETLDFFLKKQHDNE